LFSKFKKYFLGYPKVPFNLCSVIDKYFIKNFLPFKFLLRTLKTSRHFTTQKWERENSQRANCETVKRLEHTQEAQSLPLFPSFIVCNLEMKMSVEIFTVISCNLNFLLTVRFFLLRHVSGRFLLTLVSIFRFRSWGREVKIFVSNFHSLYVVRIVFSGYWADVIATEHSFVVCGGCRVILISPGIRTKLFNWMWKNLGMKNILIEMILWKILLLDQKINFETIFQ
jgi:hypothetical protein